MQSIHIQDHFTWPKRTLQLHKQMCRKQIQEEDINAKRKKKGGEEAESRIQTYRRTQLLSTLWGRCYWKIITLKTAADQQRLTFVRNKVLRRRVTFALVVNERTGSLRLLRRVRRTMRQRLRAPSRRRKNLAPHAFVVSFSQIVRSVHSHRSVDDHRRVAFLARVRKVARLTVMVSVATLGLRRQAG